MFQKIKRAFIMTKIKGLTQTDFTFLMMPKFLFVGKYRALRAVEREAYMLLLDMYKTAEYHDQKDSDGNIFITFTNQRMAYMLGLTERTIPGIKSKLEKIGLIMQKRMGFNKKTGKNNPNRIYLLEPDLSDKSLQTVDANNSPAEEHTEKTSFPRSNKYINQKPDLSKFNWNEIAKNLDNSGWEITSLLKDLLIRLTKDNKDTNDKPNQLDFSTSNYSKASVAKQNHRLLKEASPYNLSRTALACFNNLNITEFSLYTHNINELNSIMRLILRAKRQVEEDHVLDTNGMHIVLDECVEIDGRTNPVRFEITDTFRRFINRIRDPKQPRIQNQMGYLYHCYLTLFEEVLQRQYDEVREERQKNQQEANNLLY